LPSDSFAMIDDAEDVVQESFIRIWNHLQDFDSEYEITTWMYLKSLSIFAMDKAIVNKRRMSVFARLNDNSSQDDTSKVPIIEQDLNQ